MDVLIDRTYKDYDRLSRYANFPYYYNTLDNKYIYGTTSYLNQNISARAHRVRKGDTLDSLALTYYGNPTYFWVIADFNRIQDSYTKLFGNFKTIKIPALSGIRYKR